MILLDLPAVLEAAGLPVVEVSGWRTRGHGPMTDVRTIVCHHTGSKGGGQFGDYPSLRTVRDGRDLGLPTELKGPLAQLGLGVSGTWYVIAASVAWHAGVVRDGTYSNSHSIGIEAQNDGEPPLDWPAVQMDSYAAGCAALAAHYRVPVSRVLGHKEVCAPVGRKSDPDFDMDAFRRTVTTHQEGNMPLSDPDLARVRAVVREEIAADHKTARPWLSATAAKYAETLWPGITGKGIAPAYLAELVFVNVFGDDAQQDQAAAEVHQLLAAQEPPPPPAAG